MATITTDQPKSTRRTKRQRSGKQMSRLHQPATLSLEEWQIALRREYGRDQQFKLRNVGAEPIFSEFVITNPDSRNTYRVAIRGLQLGENFCSCPDYATNTLGTCKHIEFTLAQLARKRGGERALQSGFHPPYSEIYLQYGASRLLRFNPGSECPAQLARLSGTLFDAQGVLLPDAYSTVEKFLAAAADLGHELRFYDDAKAFVAEVRDAQQRRERIAQAFPRGIRSAAFKSLVKVSLYDYQREGALFAARAGRSLIGDEMGLGKTIQAIAAAEIMARLFGVERVLIICPTSLKHQWEREIERFTDRNAQVIGGLRASRQEHFATPSFFKISNYDTVHRDLDLIEDWSPDLVILDEAQRIKNWNTRAACSVKKIDAPYAIVLTGTPLENRLEELMSLVQFVDRYRLGPTFRFLHEHQDRDENGRVIGYRNLDHIGRTLEPILIRRQKNQVLKELPERLVKHFFVPMTPQQMKHHSENRETVARIVQKWQRCGFLSESDQRRLMIALQNMRMSCNSTYLLDHETDFGVKADELATLLDEIYESRDSKVVIFSQWLRTHELIQRRFEKRDWDHVLFHGGVPGPARKGLVDRFREDRDCRAFLSTDAGGVGLNLQHASVVVNMDLPWNPAVLEQRIGRVHRLGQQQPVRVVNFVATGTIEHGMLTLLQFKKSLFAGILDGGEKEVSLGGSRLKRFMESVEVATSTISDTAIEAPVDDSDSDNTSDEGASDRRPDERALALPAATPDPWAGLMQSGLALLEQFAATAKSAPPGMSGERAPTGDLSRFLAHDKTTGETFVRLPMPSPEVVNAGLQALGRLLESLSR